MFHLVVFDELVGGIDVGQVDGCRTCLLLEPGNNALKKCEFEVRLVIRLEINF